MTEREKMLSGELYDPTDKELEQLRVNARKLARKYNSTEEDDQEEQAQILRKLLPATEELPYLQAPVYFDYGCNTFFGRFSSANFNFTCLDVCEIHIGDNVMILTFILLMKYSFIAFIGETLASCTYSSTWKFSILFAYFLFSFCKFSIRIA